ncbi:hypothetical protein RUM43_011353 [Polyplax serrata]|uniref:Transmembrane protein 69 n=1 Tax=Polyplax serrata TaxID=468196 RepID=A0AAN8S3M6_POLSC
MLRIGSNRCTDCLRLVVMQQPGLHRWQHEKVRPSHDLSKPLGEEFKVHTPHIPVQGAEDLVKKAPIIQDVPLEEKSDKTVLTGEEYWNRFYKKYEKGALNFNDFRTLFGGVYKEAKYQKFQEAPSAAYTIGCVGMLPLCSIGAFNLLTGGALPWLAYVQLSYSASLLSFLGGATWTHTINANKPIMQRLGWAVVPPVLAWSAVLLPLPIGLTFTAIGLTTSMVHDILLTSYPQWFKSLRYILTIVALISMLPTFFITALKH